MTLHVGGFNGYAVAVVAMNMKHRCWCGFHGICRLGGTWNAGLRTIVLGTGDGHGLLVSDPIFPTENNLTIALGAMRYLGSKVICAYRRNMALISSMERGGKVI